VDRRRVVGRLCAAAGAGRLTLAEAADRQAAAYAARYTHELGVRLVDLPPAAPDLPPADAGRSSRDRWGDVLRAIIVVNGISFCLGLSAVPGAAGVAALLSGVSIMLAVLIIERMGRRQRGARDHVRADRPIG
jgi:hypothetical protein